MAQSYTQQECINSSELKDKVIHCSVGRMRDPSFMDAGHEAIELQMDSKGSERLDQAVISSERHQVVATINSRNMFKGKLNT